MRTTQNSLPCLGAVATAGAGAGAASRRASRSDSERMGMPRASAWLCFAPPGESPASRKVARRGWREGDRETASEKWTQLQDARLARPGDTRARVLLVLRSLLKSPPRLPEGVIGVRSGLLQLLSHSRFGFVWRRVLQLFPHALCLCNKDLGMGHDFLRLLFRCLHQVFVVALLTEVKSLPKIASGLG
jgi:hypothetical protein